MCVLQIHVEEPAPRVGDLPAQRTPDYVAMNPVSQIPIPTPTSGLPPFIPPISSSRPGARGSLPPSVVVRHSFSFLLNLPLSVLFIFLMLMAVSMQSLPPPVSPSRPLAVTMTSTMTSRPGTRATVVSSGYDVGPAPDRSPHAPSSAVPVRLQ